MSDPTTTKRGRPSTGAPRRSEVVRAAMTESEAKDIKHAAWQEGLTVSDYVRAAVLARLESKG